MLARALVWLGDVYRRVLAVAFAVVGPRAAYRFSAVLGRVLYRLVVPIRERSVAQCRAALRDHVVPIDVPRIAEQAFVHRVWNITDLLLAERLLHAGTWSRYGGQIPEPQLGALRAAQRRGQAAILVSAYYGPFDLLPVFLGYQGIRAAVLYLPNADFRFDAHRARVRARSGCELVPVHLALTRLPEVLAAGGTVGIVADHHEERGGLPATFLGLPTRTSRAVGLLAWRFNAAVVVAGIRRVRSAFRFEVDVVDVIGPTEWAGRDDAVSYITHRYLAALERLILRDPTQYLWAHARWGEEQAQVLTVGAQTKNSPPE